MSKNIVIIGGNRGIGLEFCRQYKAAGHQVFCLTRSESKELSDLGISFKTGFDVSDDKQMSQISESIPFDRIDILIHNAGILKGDRFPEVDLQNMREHFEINSLGPLKVVMALTEKLGSGSKVGLVSSRVGSIDDNTSSNNYAYRTSKTALNMIGSCLAIDLKDQGVSVALLHPGYVKTDMTGGNGNIEAPEAASGLMARMDELNLENSGHFVHSSGEKLTW